MRKPEGLHFCYMHCHIFHKLIADFLCFKQEMQSDLQQFLESVFSKGPG